MPLMARADATDLEGLDRGALVARLEQELAAAGLGFDTLVEVDALGGITISTVEGHREAEDPTPYEQVLRQVLGSSRLG